MSVTTLHRSLGTLRGHLAELQSISEKTAGVQRPIPPHLLDGLKRAVSELELGLSVPPSPKEPSDMRARVDSPPALGQGTHPTGSPQAFLPEGSNGHRVESRPVADPAPAQSAHPGSELEITNYQRRLRSLTARLLIAEERERRKLATDLHDGLSQTLALAMIRLSTLGQALDGQFAEKVAELESLVQQASTTSRAVSFELSPPILHDLGLVPALRWLVENLQSRYGVTMRYEEEGPCEPADSDERVILFRSLRELLINAAKHASARQVTLRVGRDQDMLAASVQDDGVGMDPEAMMQRGSGLFSIRERLIHVGGRMQISSSSTAGTTVRIWAPLVQATESTEKTA